MITKNKENTFLQEYYGICNYPPGNERS